MSITPGRVFDWFRSKSGANPPARRPAALRPSLKKAAYWIPRHLFILFCYAYIFGIVAGMYFHRIPPAFFPNAIVMIINAVLIAVLIGFLKRGHVSTAAALAVVGAFLGLLNYSRALDTSDPRHLVHFASEGFDENVTLTGVVSADPDIREKYTNLVVDPVTIETEDGERVRPSGGGVMVRLYPDALDSYGDYGYGDSVQVRAPLVIPRRASNPGAFDYRQWLIERQGCYATMQVRRNPEIQKLARNRTRALVDFSLRMKEQILTSIRLTMPYPESSFLGGVTLGLKGGVTQQTRYEFQATGIAHVLAVSGLHVGFVAVLLLMLAHLFNLPEKVHPAFIVMGLIVFSIITGSSPATVRAAIMFSMFICIRYYMTGLGLMASTLLTIPVAALAILLVNPLLVMDASFLLSFGAVLSLGLLTWPIQQLFNKLFVGFRLAAAGITIVILTWLAHSNWDMFFDRSTAVPIFGGLAALWALAVFLQKKLPKAFPYSFTSIHPWIGSFIAAQVAINLGNSPLFALYFYRLSVSGWYANFIAIPLCGIIVQLGILAGLLYMIPVVGSHLAAMINAGNYLFCAFFLKSASFFASNFPYPYVGTPSTEFSATYYGALLLFIYHRPIWRRVKTVHTWWVYRRTVPEVRGKLFATLGVAAVLLLLPAFYVLGDHSIGSPLRIAILDVGQGSATLIRTPAEKGVLIDGAPYDSYRDFNAGQNTVAPALSNYGINVLDHVILTTFKSEHMGGLPFLCRQFHVKEFIDCLPPAAADARTDWDTFAKQIAKTPYEPILESRSTEKSFEQYRKVLEAVEEKRARRVHPLSRQVILEEQTPQGVLRISVLPLPDTGPAAPQRTALVKIECGTWSVLLTGDLSEEEMEYAAGVDSVALDATILLLPSHGRAFDESFLSAVSPQYVVAQARAFTRRRDAEPTRKEQDLLDYFAEKNITFFQTNRDGAILIDGDGGSFSIRPYRP